MTQDELLRRIREQPSMYLGKPSVTALRHFNCGYAMRGQDCGLFPPGLGFCWHVADKYGLGHAMDVPHMALEVCNGDEEAAFDKFFELLDEYLAECGDLDNANHQ